MVQQIKEANLGLVWDEQAFLHADSIRKYHELTERPPSISTSQSEALATLPEPVRLSLKEDAKEKLQDQLSRWWSVWWLLEYLPLTRRYVKDGEVRKRMSYVSSYFRSAFSSDANESAIGSTVGVAGKYTKRNQSSTFRSK